MTENSTVESAEAVGVVESVSQSGGVISDSLPDSFYSEEAETEEREDFVNEEEDGEEQEKESQEEIIEKEIKEEVKEQKIEEKTAEQKEIERLEKAANGKQNEINKLRERLRNKRNLPQQKEDEDDPEDIPNNAKIKALEEKIDFLVNNQITMQEQLAEKEAETKIRAKFDDYDEVVANAVDLFDENTVEGRRNQVIYNTASVEQRPMILYKMGLSEMHINSKMNKTKSASSEPKSKEKSPVENVLAKIKENTQGGFKTSAGLHGQRTNLQENITEEEYVKIPVWEREKRFGDKLAKKLEAKFKY
jgi:hypothetical protein